MTFKETLFAAGREYLIRVLEQKRGNITKAAMEAGVHRATFHHYLAKYGVTVERKVTQTSASDCGDGIIPALSRR